MVKVEFSLLIVIVVVKAKKVFEILVVNNK